MAGRPREDPPSFEPVRPEEALPFEGAFDPEEPLGPDEPREPFSLPDFLTKHWPPFALVGALLLSPGSYLALAPVLPAGALVLATLAMMFAFAFLIATVWPMGTHITWSRRLEVFGYRAAVGVLAYLVVGVLVVFLLNQVTPRTIPLDWPDAQRFIPFWPFYTWFVVGCEYWGPCPPPPA